MLRVLHPVSLLSIPSDRSSMLDNCLCPEQWGNRNELQTASALIYGYVNQQTRANAAKTDADETLLNNKRVNGQPAH